MKLENQVCSLKLAKKLKYLNVKQESLFYWAADFLLYKTDTGYYTSAGAGFDKEIFERQEKTDCPFYSAFTIAELGEMLIAHRKKWEENKDMNFDLPKNPLDSVFDVNFWAKMLIYLIENKLINLK